VAQKAAYFTWRAKHDLLVYISQKDTKQQMPMASIISIITLQLKKSMKLTREKTSMSSPRNEMEQMSLLGFA
jgi:hypothetical protein